jgi:hypothetical protein
MTEQLPRLSHGPLAAGYGSRSTKTGRNPYFRMLTLLSAFLLALGLMLMFIGEASTGGILLGIGFSALIAVLITGAITWQIRQAAGPRD